MLLIVLYGTIAGVFVVGLVLLITIPMFWHDLLSDNQNFDITGFVVRNLIGGSLNTQLFHLFLDFYLCQHHQFQAKKADRN